MANQRGPRIYPNIEDRRTWAKIGSLLQGILLNLVILLLIISFEDVRVELSHQRNRTFGIRGLSEEAVRDIR